MLQYYVLKNSAEVAVVGSEYPQIDSCGGTMNRQASDSVYKVYDKFPSFIPNLNHLVLHKKAKLTDVLSCVFINSGFIISNKVKLVLSKYNIVNYKYYPAVIRHNGAMIEDNYSWFFPVGDISGQINYAKTDFFKFFSYDIEKRKTHLLINSKEDLEIAMKNSSSLERVRTSKYILNDGAFIDKDLFFIHRADTRVYVSETLAEDFKNSGILGFEMYPVKFIGKPEETVS